MSKRWVMTIVWKGDRSPDHFTCATEPIFHDRYITFIETATGNNIGIGISAIAFMRMKMYS